MKSRTIIILSALCILTINILYGQPAQMKFNDSYFLSVFTDIRSGKFIGTANGILLFKTPDDKNLILDFQGSLCNLTIEEDTDEVYDVSTKIYLAQTTSGKTHIRYQTYGMANELNIEYQGQFYNIGILDGAHDMVVDGLSYQYISEQGTEYLILRTEKELRLSNYRFLLDELINTRKDDIMDNIQKEVIEKEQFLLLQPNSVIIFAIKRAKHNGST